MTAVIDAETACDTRRITDLLTEFRENLPVDRVSLADLVDALRHRAFGGFMLAMALPTLLPLPIGMAIVFDLPLVLLSVQLMIGRQSVWLPRGLLRGSIKRDQAARMLDKLIPLMRRLEGVLRPRMPWLTSPLGERLIGTLCVALCVVLMTPIPLLGWFPAIALCVISLGLAERDGVMLMAGFGLSVATVFVSAAILAGVVQAGEALFPALGL
ncbi:exopolysaccharide biosynthesis protein [Skermanella mucosa]|uniref:exopolysaccharide biosynthesis protein n=1 Tax=Skermanella mucosa TaxID=1789672 RepID=UPI001E5FB425|nr:exopolysaccharide biosynthesis protein [Skermanella mucosa]UEM18886.1 exopolysaccharide biosynthesis protein [Skermanella mucosa]